MKKKRLMAFALATFMVFATSCGSKTNNSKGDSSIKDGGTMVLVAESDPKILNPLYGNDRTTMTINNALFSPLYVISGNRTTYYLAESLEPSKDFLTYTLKLKKGLKWHDGKELNADDMIFTLDKIFDPNQNCFLSDQLTYNGSKVKYKKIDNTTIEFKLPQVSMAFVGALAQVSPIPKHIFQGEASIEKSSKNDKPVGSGPFKFKEAKKGESVTLVRNDSYFGGKPHLNSVVYRIIADSNSANVALQNGEVSAKYIKPKDAAKYKKDDNFNVVTYDEGMLSNMIINENNDALKNKDLRQAIAYAINKEDLIKGAFVSEEYAEKAYSILTPDALYHTNDVNKFDYNVEKAKESMKKSGLKGLKLTLGYINSAKDQESEALIIQDNLKKIGIDVTFMPMEEGAYYQKITDPKNNKDMDLALNDYVMGSEPDSYKVLYKPGDNNYMNYENKDIDQLWDKAVIETDNAKRGEIYKTIQSKLADDVALYPIAYQKSTIAVNKKFGGVKEAKTVPIFMFEDLSKLYMIK